MDHMQIGEVAARTELSLRTIRHYEETGLVIPSARSQDHPDLPSHLSKRSAASPSLSGLFVGLHFVGLDEAFAGLSNDELELMRAKLSKIRDNIAAANPSSRMIA